MYASFRSVTDKNSKILTPTRTGNFFVDLSGLGILRDVVSEKHWIAQTCGSWRHFKRKEAKCSDADECIKFLLRQLPTRYSVCQGCVLREYAQQNHIFFIRTVSKAWPSVLVLDILY